MERLLHVHAKCNSFEFFEQMPENNALKRIIQFRNLFNSYGTFVRVNRKKVRTDGDKLTVKTIVVNPELPFRYNQ